MSVLRHHGTCSSSNSPGESLASSSKLRTASVAPLSFQTLDELAFVSADGKALLLQHLFEFSDGLALQIHGLTHASLGFLVQEVGGQASFQTSSPVHRRPMSCS